MTLTHTQQLNYLIGTIESNTTVAPLANPLIILSHNCSAGCDAIGMMDLGG